MTSVMTRKLAAGRSGDEIAELTAKVRAEAGRLRLLRQCPTALDLAARFDRTVVRTPALELLNRRLHETVNTPGGRLVVSIPPQEGKALALDTPIATPTGWSTIGNLRVGDQVFDRRGEVCTVTALSPVWHGRPCYTVRTGDGECIVADAVHEWPARLDRRTNEYPHETSVLARPRSKNAQITGPAGLNLPYADLPIDPYVLGVWLGDGHSGSPLVTTADPEVLDRIRDAGVPVRPTTVPITWRLTPAPTDGFTRSRGGLVRLALKSLGLIRNKHIPTVYMRAAEKQRLALLQGLIDSDGYVMPKGQIEFCSTNRRLAEDVRDLVFTLGAKAVMGTGRAMLDGRDCGPKYRVRFYLADAASLPRKARYCKDSSVARVRYTWAEPTASVPVRCIEVDSSDHTYLAGRSLLPTYNSTLARWMILRALLADPDRRVVFASYAAGLAKASGRIVRDLVETHRANVGVAVDQAHRDASDWQLAGRQGGLFCCGVGGALTGKPADVLIIDDPLKGHEQADSETVRGALHLWWEGVARTRLASGAPVVVIATRWHEQDLSGRLIGEGWPALNIPAVADGATTDGLDRPAGEWLVSAQGRTTVEWEDTRRDVGERVFNALYQGRPSPPGGGIFRTEWFDRDRADTPPDRCAPPVVMVDPADNTGTGDEAGIIVGRLDPADRHVYIGPDYSGHYTTGRWVRVALLAVLRHQAAALAYERSLSGLDRSVKDGWQLLAKQAGVLRRLGATPDGDPDPAVIEAAAAELCHPDDPDQTVADTRAELIELWPLTDTATLYPSGPTILRINPRGSKQLRSQLTAPMYENRRVHHLGRLPVLEHQMATWQPTMDSPDRMDAAVHLLLHLAGASVTSFGRTSDRLPTRSTRARRRGVGSLIGPSTGRRP